MNKLDFITRQFSKAEKKRFEHYVVTRIWHLLDDLSIKFVTQQYVNRSKGKIALTDMFFPQLQIHIEVDEGHHKYPTMIDQDKLREIDIVNATGHEICRVDVTNDIETINKNIYQVIEKIKSKKIGTIDFLPWDIEAEINPQTYISKGFIDLKDNCAFKSMVDAANCFGNKFKPKGIWKGSAKHPKESGKLIWFPKLYKNDKWNNSISNDEMEIREICELPEIINPHIDSVIASGFHKRIVFARVKSPLGDIMYRFKGEYELDKDSTNYNTGLLWKRISGRVNTYTN